MKGSTPRLDRAHRLFQDGRLTGIASAYVALGIVVLLAGSGILYQAVGERRDHRLFPPRASLSLVARRRMHLPCTGQGSPTVILEAPQTGLAAVWIPVQRAVQRFVRVCSYDRAGFGWSEAGPLPRTTERIAFELHSL